VDGQRKLKREGEGERGVEREKCGHENEVMITIL
jgi:hypothetical protein